jgi:predicted RNA binding protein YcfA (HicA-like mRNA interferase family)
MLAALGRAGFSMARTKGSHVRLRHPDGRAVTVPVHPGDLRAGTAAAILKAAQISPEEFRQLL